MVTAFVDDFTTLNPRWTAQNGPGRTGTGDAECYRPYAVTTGPNGLTLTAVTGSPDPNFTYTSGEIDTGFIFTGGAFSARCKMPATPAVGLWPAFWLVNNHSTVPPQEIDIFEWFGNHPTQIKCNYIWSYSGAPGTQTNTTYDTGVDLSIGFHEYGLQWTPYGLHWTFDGKIVKSWLPVDAAAAGAPFPTAPMHLIFNHGVGNSRALPGTPGPTTVLPAQFQVTRLAYSPIP